MDISFSDRFTHIIFEKHDLCMFPKRAFLLVKVNAFQKWFRHGILSHRPRGRGQLRNKKSGNWETLRFSWSPFPSNFMVGADVASANPLQRQRIKEWKWYFCCLPFKKILFFTRVVLIDEKNMFYKLDVLSRSTNAEASWLLCKHKKPCDLWDKGIKQKPLCRNRKTTLCLF